jgi:ATP-dependent Clp protease adaptor protein ClpS
LDAYARPNHFCFSTRTQTTAAIRAALWKAGNVADTLDRTEEETDLNTVVLPDRPWITIVWNDPVNLQNYVTWVFKSYFGFPPAEAKRLMLQVHNDGRAVVATGSREEMERHVVAMHGYGLWATLQKDDE